MKEHWDSVRPGEKMRLRFLPALTSLSLKQWLSSEDHVVFWAMHAFLALVSALNPMYLIHIPYLLHRRRAKQQWRVWIFFLTTPSTIVTESLGSRKRILYSYTKRRQFSIVSFPHIRGQCGKEISPPAWRPHWSLLGISEWGHTKEAHRHQGTDKVILKFLPVCLLGGTFYSVSSFWAMTNNLTVKG